MDDRQACSTMIRKIHTTLEKQANRILKEADMTFAQQSVLMALNESSGHQLPLKELEQKLCLSQSTVVGLVSRLYQKGTVEYLPDPTDRRVKIIHLTGAGENRCLEAQIDMDRSETSLLGALTETEQQILRSLLTKICSAL